MEKAGDEEQAPSAEELRELYEAATRFRDAGCWEWMSDADLFAVQNPEDGETGYCCVMGQAGEHFALGVYLGSEGLDGYLRLASGQVGGEYTEILSLQKMLMASFEDRAELVKQDLETIRQIGLKFRGRGAWPLFRSYRPGYYPWFVTGPEARFLATALRQSLDVALRFEDDPDLLPPIESGRFLVRVPGEGGAGWRDEIREPAPPVSSADSGDAVDKARLARMRKELRLTDGVLEIDAFPSPMKIQGSARERPVLPYVILAADQRSGYLFATEIAGRRELPGKLPDTFLDLAERLGMLPGKVVVGREEVFAWLEPVTKPLGIRLSRVKTLRAVEPARDGLFDYLG